MCNFLLSVLSSLPVTTNVSRPILLIQAAGTELRSLLECFIGISVYIKLRIATSTYVW